MTVQSIEVIKFNIASYIHFLILAITKLLIKTNNAKALLIIQIRNTYFVSFQISTFINLLSIMISSNKVKTIAICETTLGLCSKINSTQLTAIQMLRVSMPSPKPCLCYL